MVISLHKKLQKNFWVTLDVAMHGAAMSTVARLVVVVVCVISVLYNIPRWFEYRPHVQISADTNSTTVVAARTLLATDPMHVRVYYSWLYLPVMCIVPLVALLTFNTSLVLAVRRSRTDRKRMNVHQCRENNVTLMLVSVVAVFVVCQVCVFT